MGGEAPRGDQQCLQEKCAHQGFHGGGAKVSSQGGSHDLDSSEMSAGKLSGESHPIGPTEWDENTLFGKHVVFI
ncbi:UNVERIFIED_ORG: hypothetical protein J2S29_004988 [Rhizobium sp. SLBN-170]